MRRFKKPIIILVLSVIISANIVLALPQKAQAQFVVSVPNLETMSIREWIVNTLKSLLKTVLFQGLMNALNYFMQKLAYDAAVWLASGGKGQGTLFESKNWGDYMKDVALDTAGEFIGTLSEEEGWPIDLCQPVASDVTGLLGDITPQITMNLQLGLADTYEPRPRCEWNQIASNWDEFLSSNTSDQILAQFTQSMRPGEDGLGSALSLFEKVSSESAKKEEAAVQSRQEGKGVKSVETKVSGHVETPSYLVGEQFKQQTIDQPAEGQSQNVSGSLSISDSVLSMGLNIGSMFLNTLTSKLFGNLMSGFFDAGELVSEKKSLWDLGSSSEPEGGRIAAERIFADLLKPTFLEITNWNPLMEFSVCPPERGTNNCVIDSSFAAALTEAAAKNPISIHTAMEREYLHKDWPLIPLIDRSKSQDPQCHNYGYCAVNLSKLRKARIIPIGWEIAANLPENNPSSPITLGEVVANFNNPGPYYHLIDPNWVLKMPATQCKMKVNGSKLVSSEGDLRENVCVDTPSCLAEDPDGKCSGAWGYCTREKNVWRIKGDTCPKEFSSCENLTTRDKKKVAYLRNTLDYNYCNAENVGCAWYSTEKNSTGLWDSAKRIYLDKDVVECKPTAAGCTDLIRKTRGISVNLINNSSFEKDENGDNFPEGWEQIREGAGMVAYDTSRNNSWRGSDAARLYRNPPEGRYSSYQQNLSSLPAGTYAVSLYAKQEIADSRMTGVDLILRSASGASLNIALADPANRDCVLFETGLRLNFIPSNDYTRKSCVFHLNSTGNVIMFLQSWGEVRGIFVDAIQLEEEMAVTNYHEEGYPFTAEHTTMKVPPAYLGCTGKIEDKKECNNYARVCSFEDVGCDLFTPTNGEPPISAKISEEDFCPAECAGYALFRQEATNFERANPSVYLIPKSARTCSADSVGCTEFTDTATGAVSYHSFLRRCGTEGGANYYTWEGSDTTGYQIKSWSLSRGRPNGREVGDPPAYQSGFADYEACTAEIFRAGSNPDCREFYDEAGNISYRLYSKTIVVTPECKNLRKTLAGTDIVDQESDCVFSGGSWTVKGCLFNGYLAESIACSGEQKDCRAYGGNASRNVFVAFEDDFENGGITGWEQTNKVFLSTESLQVGGHSLKAGGARYVRTKIPNFHDGGIYNLSFWAKGVVGGKLEVLFEFDDSRDPNLTFSSPNNPKVNLATEWRLYNLGPVFVNRAPSAGGYLSFYLVDSTGARIEMSNVFMDNIVLREVSQNIYLIKDSWIIPSACNKTIRGEVLPQAMVGCQEYRDTKKNLRYLKSFSSLCLENAAGCEAFIDTKNNENIFSETKNARCLTRDAVVAEGGSDCSVGGKVYCHIRKGENSCYFDADFNAIEERVQMCKDAVIEAGPEICRDTSALVIPKDDVLYLVNDNKMYCASEDVGCKNVGVPDLKLDRIGEEDDATYNDRVLKLRPSFFGGILCRENELWCEEFKRDDKKGAIIYAKNPRERICEYKKNVLVGGVETDGWFKKDTELPCYEGNEILRNADIGYGGWVGTCEKKYSGCTTLVDPSDISEDHPDGKPYYVIRDDEELDTESCKGKISKIEGCVLFKDLNDPTATYRADSSYLRSRDEASGGAVTAVSCPTNEPNCKRCAFLTTTCSDFMAAAVGPSGGEPLGAGVGGVRTCYNGFNRGCRTDADCVGTVPPVGSALLPPPRSAVATPKCVGMATGGEHFISLKNDSNLIVKVTPDRECGEWLGCLSTATVWDETSGKYKKICTAVDLCREFKKIGENEAKCVKYVKGDIDGKVLNKDNYKKRDVSWSGMDYSGYSIPNKYQIDDLKVVDVGENDKRLVKVLGSCGGADGAVCKVPNTEKGIEGKCYNWNCIRGIDDTVPQSDLSSKRAKTSIVSRMCRAYPEQNSPFPATIADWKQYLGKTTQGALSAKKQGYSNATVCEQKVWLDNDADNIVDDGELIPQNCECSYQKATYGRGTLAKYFSYNQEFLPEGICLGGPRDGLPCVVGKKDICGTIEEGGSCERLTRADKYLGLEGYCVEYDYSSPINSTRDEFSCLAWRPVEIPEGGQDVYNQYVEAGYNPPSAGVGKYFCLMGKGNAMNKISSWDMSMDGTRTIDTNVLKTYFSPRYSVNYYQPPGADKLPIIFPYTDHDNYKEVIRTRLALAGLTETLPLYKGDMAGIVLNLIKFDGNDITDTEYFSGDIETFTKDKNNILSRNSKHQGKFTTPGGEIYSYWEVRFPDTEDGIKDWETGFLTKGTKHPLFVMPWENESEFERDRLVKELTLTNCSGAADGGRRGNYFAVRAYFDSDDKFQGIWVSSCDYSSHAGGVELQLEFLKAEPCIYVVRTLGPNNENRAKTHNSWSFVNRDSLPPSSRYTYDYNQRNIPFGSAANSPKNIEISSEPWFLGPDGFGSPYFTTAYFPQTSVDAGSPLGCREGQAIRQATPITNVHGVLLRTEYSAPSRVGCLRAEGNVSLGFNLADAKTELQKLFADIYGVYKWNNETGNYQLIDDERHPVVFEGWGTDATVDLSDWNLTSTGKPVKIYTVGGEHKSGFSINDQTDGILTGQQNFEARIKFYAWADKNQMPITSRWIDWKDGTSAEKYYGKYKNHKQFCSSSNEIQGAVKECTPNPGYREIGGLTCKSGGDCPVGYSCTDVGLSFGNSPEACEEGYFEFSHNYICTKEMLKNLPTCNKISVNIDEFTRVEKSCIDPTLPLDQKGNCSPSPCKEKDSARKDVCVFRPQVRILDNWGWCTANSRDYCERETYPVGLEPGSFPEVIFNGSIVVSP